MVTSTAESLKEGGNAEEAAKVSKWNDDWLSLLGVSKGITGLAKDFAVNYLGRSSYQDSNGPLIESIKKAAAIYPAGTPDSDDIKYLCKGVKDVCSEGMKLFKKDGSLYTMLSELKAILGRDSNAKHFGKGLTENPVVKKAFNYLAGPKPGSSDEDDPDFDEEL